MPGIVRHVDRDQQPQCAIAGPDVAWLWTPTLANDAARNSPVQIGGAPASGPGSDAVSLRIDSTSKYIYSTEGVRVLGSGSFTLLWRFKQSSTVMHGGSMFSGTGTPGSQNRIDIYSLSSGVIRCDMYNSAGSPTNVDSAAALSVGGLYTVALVYNAVASSLQWYVNGVASGSPSTPGARTGAGSDFTFGGNVGGQAANQDYSLLAVISGAPPPGELMDIHRAPWQLLAPEQSYVPFASGGGGAAALAGAATSGATATGALTTAIQAAASVSASASVTAALSTGIPLAASLSGSASVSAAITTAIQLNGSLSATASVTGDISGAAALASSVSTSAIVTGDLTTAIRLNASVSGAATVTGVLAEPGAAAVLEASIAASATVSASLTGGSSTIWTPASASSGTWVAQ